MFYWRWLFIYLFFFITEAGCDYRGDYIAPGQARKVDPCTTCHCNGNSVSCTTETCPALFCARHEKVEGECCESCTYCKCIWEKNNKVFGRLKPNSRLGSGGYFYLYIYFWKSKKFWKMQKKKKKKKSFLLTMVKMYSKKPKINHLDI